MGLGLYPWWNCKLLFFLCSHQLSFPPVDFGSLNLVIRYLFDSFLSLHQVEHLAHATDSPSGNRLRIGEKMEPRKFCRHFIFLPPSSCLNDLALPECCSWLLLEVRGMVCSCLCCQSRTKNLIWQKHRTQKNECCIFLRSIFLPL